MKVRVGKTWKMPLRGYGIDHLPLLPGIQLYFQIRALYSPKGLTPLKCTRPRSAFQPTHKVQVFSCGLRWCEQLLRACTPHTDFHVNDTAETCTTPAVLEGLTQTARNTTSTPQNRSLSINCPTGVHMTSILDL